MPDSGQLTERSCEMLLSEPSLQDLMDRIRADPSLPQAKRSQWCCSLRRISAFLERHPSHLPARMSALRHGISGLHHDNLGIAKKTLQNHLANLKAALSYEGKASNSSIE